MNNRVKNRKNSYKEQLDSKIIEWGILFILVFSPLPAASVYEWSILVIQLTVFIMLGAYILMRIKSRNNTLLFNAVRMPGYLFGGFIGLIVFQIIPLPKFLVKILSPQAFTLYKNYSSNISEMHFMSISVISSFTIKEGLEILTYLIFGFLIIRTITRKKQIVRIFSVIIAMGAFEALYGFIQLYSKNPSLLFYKKVHYLDCVTGTFVNRNHLSGYLEMIIPVAVGLIVARIGLFNWFGLDRKEKLLRISEQGLAKNVLIVLGIMAMALAVIYSKSRSGVFVLILSFILLSGLTAIYSKRSSEDKKRIRKFIKVIFLLIVVFSLYLGIESTLERFSLDDLLQEQRPMVWKNTLEMIADFPVFGTGLGTFGSIYPAYEESGMFVQYSHAHNDYLEYLDETGVLGITLLFGGIIYMLIQSFLIWKERRHPQVKGLVLGGIVAVLSILVHSITDFNLHIPANMILFTAILSLTILTAFYKRH